MRLGAVCCVCLVGCGLLPAAPINPTPSTNPGKPPDAQFLAESHNYANQLLFTAAMVSEQYVRPVAKKDLLVAALKGLYEAARVPVANSAITKLEKAESDADLETALAEARIALGDHESIRGSQAMLVSCQAMARSLDPYSAVVSGEELRRGNGVDSQFGVGITLADNQGVGPLIIKTVLAGGPAQKAGLRPGDEIVTIGDKQARGMTSAVALMSLNASLPSAGVEQVAMQETDTVKVTVQREGWKKAKEFELERREFRAETILGVQRRDDNSWDYWADRKNKIAHVRISHLANGSARELRETLTQLQSDGMRALILDVRWTPGGYLNESINAAALFLGDCTVAKVKSRSEKEVVYPSTKGEKFLDFPVLVLVNGETSGGAELIAAALQDNGRAKVAGMRTLGKGSIQTMLGIPVPNAGLKLTSGTFVRPSGKNMHRFNDSKASDDWGVRPDEKLDFRASPDLSKQLKEWWQMQTLRPGTSREALPLDNPDNDPQRQQAVKAILKMLK